MSQATDKGLFARGVKRSLMSNLFDAEYEFLINALTAFTRILPHTETEEWKIVRDTTESSAWWKTIDGEQRRGIGLIIYVPQLNACLESMVTRRVPGEGVRNVRRVPDSTEMAVCKRIVESASQTLRRISTKVDGDVINDLETGVEQSTARESKTLGTRVQRMRRRILRSVEGTLEKLQTPAPPEMVDELRRNFDDRIVVDYLKEFNQLSFDLGDLIEFLRVLSEQSYENKAMSFGVLIKRETDASSKHNFVFPLDFEREKRFKAFTDGYRSAYVLDRAGHILELVDLEELGAKGVRGEHYFPEWSRNIALSSRRGTIGLSLTRQGDILYFENGSLKFTRRAGKWQYWNHAYIIDILQNKVRAQRVDPKKLGKVVATLYRYALDVSFRRSGCLFVILGRVKDLQQIVRKGDALADSKRLKQHKDFERFLANRTILGLDRNVVLELSAIDGALVFSNTGRLLAYGAVLEPAKKSHIRKVEGSRSKAAVGASHFGISIKISSDGGITMYEEGKPFIEV